MTVPLCNPHGAVFEFLAARCPPAPVFPPPWDFLPLTPGCLGPVPDPGATLAALRAAFPDARLARAGVLRPSPDGLPRLAPELGNPAGALVPFHDRASRKPYALLTPRGCLAAQRDPITAALKDEWTAAGVAKWGALFATPHVAEAVLLRALGLPVTLSVGIGRLSAAGLKALDAGFAAPDYPSGPGPARPLLVFVDWAVRAAAAGAVPALSNALARVAAARQHLDLPFAGVAVWRPPAADLAALRFRRSLRDVASVRSLLQESAAGAASISIPTDAPPVPPYPVALADLLAAQAAEREGDDPAKDVESARLAYEAAVRRDLVAPLQARALASADPVRRAAGAELAGVAGLLHGLTPALHDITAGGADPVAAGHLARYLKLAGRFDSLLRFLDK